MGVRCAHCQEDNSVAAKFCNGCGARLQAVCAACGHPNAPGSRFCNDCGRPLAGPAPAADSRLASPLTYTPRHLAEKILTSRAALEGERKQVTVLFADMKGSMELLAGRDPEEARRLIDPVLERLMEAVHRYEGTVNQVLGDGIMALFGAPLAHEDHAVRACYAALAMQESVQRYTEEIRAAHGVEVQIRVGLNSGEVVVRAIGNDLHMDYSAVGQTTHLAARMEQLARPATIRLTRETLRLAEGFVETTPLGPVLVKGLSEPVEAFELAGAATTRTRLQAGAARGLTRFVGRDRELDQLGHALETSRAGHGQVVAVIGEPGVGKSRLYWEFVHSYRTQGWLILEASSVSYGQTSTFLPVIELLKSYFLVDRRDDAPKIREKITGKLLTLDEGLLPTLPGFLSLLDVPVEDPTWQALDPAQRRHRGLDAVKGLFLRESRVQPLCLVLEDLHWIDSETQGLLEALVESLPTSRLLLLMNFRPDYRHGWGNKTYYTQLRLDPLPPETAEDLLHALVGDDVELEPLKRLLIERTEGNPFFLEESVRTLVESSVLVGERAAYRMAKTLDAVHVPATVQAVLAARIDRLSPGDKAVLQTAAVIGKDVPFALLHAIAEVSEETLRLGLSRLRTAEFLYETALFPDLEYTFKHALTQEVAYGGLLHERRRALHARIVQTFETLYPERLTERVGWLTHHAFRGEVWSKAVTYLRQYEAPSLDSYTGFGAYGNSGHLWWVGDHEHAVRAAQQELDAAAVMFRGWAFSLQVTTNLRLGQAYHSLGDYPHGIEALRRNVAALDGELLHELCSLAGLPSVLSRAWLALCLGEQGELAEGIAHGDEAVRIGEGADHPYSVIVACYGLGSLYLLEGNFCQAITILKRALSLCEVEDTRRLFPFVASPLGSAYALSRRLEAGITLLEQAVERAVSTKLMANHSQRLCRLGEADLLAGRLSPALRLALQALELSREHKERGHEAYAHRLLGEITADGDRPHVETAADHYRHALAIAEQLGMRPLQGHCRFGLGNLYRRAGQREEAQAQLSMASDLFRAMGMSFWLGRA
jgi:class 3 adenylate cyclase/tetratricopeptide (TPR) repeat protein